VPEESGGLEQEPDLHCKEEELTLEDLGKEVEGEEAEEDKEMPVPPPIPSEEPDLSEV
jgi:hypothetical protein